MIKVTFIQDDKRFILKMEGHANTAEYGHDLICAVASAHVQLLGTIVKEMAMKQKLAMPPTVRWESGEAFIDAMSTDAAYAELKTVFHVIETGFRQLEVTEPKAISVTIII